MKKKLAFIAIVSIFTGAVSMCFSWQHNSQCEVHCEGVIYWGYWLGVGMSWFILTFLPLFLVVILGRWYRARNQKNT
jgi:uncharacterized membrane protein